MRNSQSKLMAYACRVGGFFALAFLGMGPSKVMASVTVPLVERIEQKTAPIGRLSVSSPHRCPATHSHCIHLVRSNAAQSLLRRLKGVFDEQSLLLNRFDLSDNITVVGNERDQLPGSAIFPLIATPFKKIFALTMRMQV